MAGVPSAAAGTLKAYDFDAALLYYRESGGRVSAVEPVINVRRTFSGNRSLNLKFTLDVLTGASPSGALAANTPQTFTRPSGMGDYTVEPGQTPLDDSFHDTRVAFSGTWEQPLGRLSQLALGANVSTEYDFFSMGANAVCSRDFNERNTRLTLGLSLERDLINPVGDVPTPFAAMAAAGTPQPRRGSSETKLVVDGLLGLTQVLDARTITQLNYSLSRADGYLNDPYKIVGVVDPATGDPLRYLYEERPGTRTKHALYWLLRRHLGRDIASGSYRFLIDDWGLLSHTVDLNYRWKPSERWWLEPHLRFYRQSQADFYRLQLLDGEPLPARASSDYRLAAFKAYTLGLQHGWNFENETALIVKAEYYFTRGEQDPSGVLPSQRHLPLYPDMKATILQVQYRF